MQTVHVLWYEREYPDRDDTELQIGIYATRDDAEAAIGLLKDQPGFRDFSDGFHIYETQLGHTGWRFGFVTEYGPPPKSAASEAFDLPAFD